MDSMPLQMNMPNDYGYMDEEVNLISFHTSSLRHGKGWTRWSGKWICDQPTMPTHTCSLCDRVFVWAILVTGGYARVLALCSSISP